jgi:simple sugar transport system substrate-binding protein
MKASAIIALGVVVIAAGAGCGSSSSGAVKSASSSSAAPAASSAGSGAESAGDSSIKIAYVCATASQQPFFVPLQKGAEAAAKAMGVELDYTGLTQPGVFTAPVMTSALQTALNQNPSAIIACDFFPPSEDPLLKQAAGKGIPVFVTGSTSPASSAVAAATFSENNYEGGVQAAKVMSQTGVKNGLCVDDNVQDPVVASRCTGFVAGAKAAGIKAGIDNLPQGSSSDETVEVNAVKAALAKDPTIDGILMMGPVQGPAAVLGVQEAGLAGKVKVGTFDLSQSVLNDIKSGSMDFGIWQEPYLEGYLPVEAAAWYVRYGMSPTSSVGTGPVMVTSANVAKVQAATNSFGG